MEFPSSHDHELVLFFYPSPGISWKSPAMLTLTAAFCRLTKMPRSIGHVSIRVRSKGDRPIDFHTGMTQESGEEGQAEIFAHGYGLGILYHDFLGTLESTEALDAEVKTRSFQRGKLSYIRYEITREIAERLENYVKEFSARGAHEHYGSPHRPLYGEGGGCSAFAASFLEIAGLLTDDHRSSWSRTHRLPRAYIGGPKTGHFVQPWKLLLRHTWAGEGEDAEEFFIWDPDLMHAWCMKLWKREKQKSEGHYRIESWREAHGIVFDHKSAVCPTGPLFLGDPDTTRYYRGK